MNRVLSNYPNWNRLKLEYLKYTYFRRHCPPYHSLRDKQMSHFFAFLRSCFTVRLHLVAQHHQESPEADPRQQHWIPSVQGGNGQREGEEVDRAGLE